MILGMPGVVFKVLDEMMFAHLLDTVCLTLLQLCWVGHVFNFQF